VKREGKTNLDLRSFGLAQNHVSRKRAKNKKFEARNPKFETNPIDQKAERVSSDEEREIFPSTLAPATLAPRISIFGFWILFRYVLAR
jgi:hypothetical protein